MKQEGCSPNSVTYNTLLGVLIRAGRCRAALQALAEMKEKDLEPDEVTWSILGKLPPSYFQDATEMFSE
jgi:pentatricopeptide repeat protein